MDNKNYLGRNLREIRKSQNLTAEQVAEMAEISEGFLKKIEAGSREPSLDTFISLCNVLSADVDEVLEPLLQLETIQDKEDLIDKIVKSEIDSNICAILQDVIIIMNQEKTL